MTTMMKDEYRVSYQQFQRKVGKKYRRGSMNPFYSDRSMIQSLIRLSDREHCWVEVFPEGGGYTVYEPEKLQKDITLKRIFEATGIMLHRRNAEGKYTATTGNREPLGLFRRDPDAWCFEAEPDSRYPGKLMSDISTALRYLDQRDSDKF